MWSLLVLVPLLGLSSVEASDKITSGFVPWFPANTTAETIKGNTDNALCEAEGVLVTKNMEIPEFQELKCALRLKVLVADNVGLKSITNASLDALPRSVENLTMVRNSIPLLLDFTFANLTLKHLNLSSNNIEMVAPGAFDNMTALETLVLDHNKIAIFNFTFQKCAKLKVISLKHNLLAKLYEGTLKYVKNNVLSILLSYNNIREAHKSALDVKQFHVVHLDHNQLNNAVLLVKLVKAELVDLSMNNITCLPKEFMENGLSKIRTLNLTGNPLECQCLQDLRRKMRKNVEFQKMSPIVQNINIVLPKSSNGTKQC